MTRQRKHVRDRRSHGFCAYEGCPVRSKKNYRCRDHAAAHAEAMAAARAGRARAA